MGSSKVVAKSNIVACLLKGVLISICVSLAGIFLFAFILKFINLSDVFIKIINQVIKILSVFFGVKVFTKSDKSKMLPKGLLIGVLYTVFSYLVFSILVSSFSFGLNLIYDILFLGIAGMLCSFILGLSKK